MELERLEQCMVCSSAEVAPLDAERCFGRCQRCGYTFDNPRPTTAEIIRFYSKPQKYQHWIDAERARDEMWKRRLRKLERARVSGALLDVGAGIGQFLHHARVQFPEALGTEVSAEAVQVGRDRYGLELIEGEFEQMQLEGRFDVVTLFHVLEHVPNPRHTVERCYAALRPGGTIVIAVPNDVRSLRQGVKRALGRVGMKRYRDLGPLALPRLTLDERTQEVHLSHFTPDVLVWLLESVGFSGVHRSLDPYFAQRGLRRRVSQAYYGLCASLEWLTGVNLYDTIWVDARRPAEPGAAEAALRA